MFDGDYTLTGKHATCTKYLYESGVFKRYIDVYMNGAIFGFLYGRKAERDTTTNDRGRIYADAFATERSRCDFIFRLIMLLDETQNCTAQERIDRAFREDSLGGEAKDRNQELFHSYVRGGIEVLFEIFAEGCTSRDDFVTKMYEVVTDFEEELEGGKYTDRLREAMGDYIVG